MKYKIRLPENKTQLPINEEYFFLEEDNEEKIIKLHDYSKIYSLAGLYEQLAIDMLGYQSHEFMAKFLAEELQKEAINSDSMRVLELGAGSGLFGREIYNIGIESLIGVDIVPEASTAANHGDKKIYQDYLIEDFTDISLNAREKIVAYKPNVFVCCSALSQSHIPILAFKNGINFIGKNSWILFNISKSSYEDENHEVMVFFREALDKKQLKIASMKNYIHRKFCNGNNLQYVALLLRKVSHMD